VNEFIIIDFTADVSTYSLCTVY